MEIIRQFTISTASDIMSLDIIDFNRLNGCWSNSGKAIDTILSWFNGAAIATEVIIHNYFDAPKRLDFPGWDHVGGHEKIGRLYWDWFYWNHENGKLNYSDSPDFYGEFDDGAMFWGDVGRVSASAFAMTQKGMRDHDLWITLKGNGDHQILIEPQVDICELFGSIVFGQGRGLTPRAPDVGNVPQEFSNFD